MAEAGVGADDLVLEIGAGTGRITDALAHASARVVAVELDPSFAESLRRRFRDVPSVTIAEGDALRIRLPRAPFRVFGSVPFSLTTAILRRLLDDPASPLVRCDLIVQYEVGLKRASVWPSNVLSLGWLPWWDFRLARHLPASAFEPAPRVDAGLLTITRRPRPFLPATRREEYLTVVRAAFDRVGLPVHRSLRGRLPERAWKRIARERGIGHGARARDLDVFDWVVLFDLVREFNRM